MFQYKMQLIENEFHGFRNKKKLLAGANIEELIAQRSEA